MLKREYESVVPSRVEFSSMEDWLRSELGEYYLDNNERFELGKTIDIGIYDDAGILIGFKEDMDD